MIARIATLASTVLIFLVTLGAALPAAAQQNLSVRPMKVEADIPANRNARVVLRVNNRHPTRTEPLNLSVVDLTQAPDGSLRIVRDEMRAEMDPESLRASSRDWVELPAERIEVPPETTTEIPVLWRVPPDARGAYASAVMIRTDAPPMPEGEEGEQSAVFAISFGFLIPLITEIEGRPVRQDISIAGLSMTRDDGKNEAGEEVREPTTRVSMEIVNDGRTYSSLDGEIVVERRSGEHWRTVTRGDLADKDILPGLTLKLSSDLGRRLPSGQYRLLGNLEVDGRRLPRFERVIDFEGDPEIDEVAYDTTLTLSPPRLSLTALPGATRTGTVEIGNPGAEPLEVSVKIETPKSLRGMAMGDLMGEQLSAAGWTMLRPAKLTLRPGQKRNIRVISRMPREARQLPNYYADIRLEGKYMSGQSAGETRSRLHVRHEQVENSVDAVIDSMSVSRGDTPASYILQSRLVNTGTVDIAPVLRGELLIPDIGQRVKGWRLGGTEEAVLPLGTRNYAGTVDLGPVEAGEYVLRVLAEQDGERISERTLRVKIETAAGSEDGQERKRLTVLEDG